MITENLCTICARGGSKGVKNKNIRLINGLPLIAHSILQAQKTNLFSKIAVSSDSDDILNVAKTFGVDVLIKRPDELATDTAGKVQAIKHAVEQTESRIKTQFKYFVDLDCTSPLRSVDDIIQSLNLLRNTPTAANLVTASPSRRSPYFNLLEATEKKPFVQLSKNIQPRPLRRQDTPMCYDMNASIYVWNRRGLFYEPYVINDHTIVFEMPEERSVDIDSELDFEFVEFLMKKKG